MRKLDKILAVLLCLILFVSVGTLSALAVTNDGSSVVTSEVPSKTPSEVPGKVTSDVSSKITSDVSSQAASDAPSQTTSDVSSQVTDVSSAKAEDSRVEASQAPTYTESKNTQAVGNNDDEASLLPAASHESTSEVSSQNWAALLSGVESGNVPSSVPDLVFSEANKTNEVQGGGSQWLLIVGILLIALAVAGIGFVIYTQFFSKKAPHTVNKAAVPNKKQADIYGRTRELPKADAGDDYGDDYNYDAYVISHDTEDVDENEISSDSHRKKNKKDRFN